jgi:hypothetical protein
LQPRFGYQQKLAWQKMRYSYYARQSRVTKTVVAVLLTSVLMVGAAFPRMVYQVMVNDQCIGTVRSTETVQKIVDAYLAEKGENLPYALVVDPAVSYFPVRQTESLTSVQQFANRFTKCGNRKSAGICHPYCRQSNGSACGIC